MNTSAVSLIDTLDLCTEAVMEESSFSKCPTFADYHCSNDIRDVDFNRVESRLAYLSKYGIFNVTFFEKCISTFLYGCFDSDNIPLQNLKVCSLSSGPGLDLVGLFCALNNCNKSLGCPPEVRAVNLYDSWLRMYLSIVGKTYKAACQKLCSGNANAPTIYENTQFIQCDIFTDMSPEAENFISNSNVLLMFDALDSTKASRYVQQDTLKKIVSLIKPGTLVFFTSSIDNLKTFSRSGVMNTSVKYAFNRQKIELENLSYPKVYIANTYNIKPKDSGNSKFFVWKKKENNVSVHKTFPFQKTPKKGYYREKKNKVLKATRELCSENMAIKNIDDAGVGSKMSYSSCSKKFITEPLKKLQKIECGISSANDIIPVLNKIALNNPIIDNNAIQEIKEELQRIDNEISLLKADFLIIVKTVLNNVRNKEAKEALDKLQRVRCEGLIDTFDLCTKAAQEESIFFLGPTFNNSHCQTDSRGIDFNRIECRLAYLNKYGFFYVKFSEKCISMFLNEYNDLDNAFPLQNLKVCSLSNGPGLDLVGLFCALNICNKTLGSPPEVRAVNLYDSWLRIYISILGKTYKAACKKLYSENARIIYKNIQFIQGDIFADLSQEAENSINNSNVVLMIEAFNSTKANLDAKQDALKKIFSLIKPGTLVFFTVSNNNFKKFAKCSFLQSFVKYKFGPKIVKLENSFYPEFYTDAKTAEPQDSRNSKFVVWQKRQGIVSICQKKEIEILKAATTLCSENRTSQNIDDDVESNMSYTSSSETSESSEESSS